MPFGHGNPAFVPVTVEVDLSRLSDVDKQVVNLGQQALGGLDTAFLRLMRQNLPAQGGIYDPSVGTGGYPDGMTAEQFAAYLVAHPLQKADLTQPYAVVRSRGDELYSVPYSEYFADEFRPISARMRDMANLSEDAAFAAYLTARAEAMLDNNHIRADSLYLLANTGSLEFAASAGIEAYSDTIGGHQQMPGGYFSIVCEGGEEVQTLDFLQQHLGGFDVWLGDRYGYEANPRPIPMRVVDQFAAAGEGKYGINPIAMSLPNDDRVRAVSGSKLTFIRNMMAAKHHAVSAPISDIILLADDLAENTPLVGFSVVAAHEIAHGVKIYFPGERFGPIGNMVEECKADILGQVLYYYLWKQGKITKDQFVVVIKNQVSRCARSTRAMKASVAHGGGSAYQLNRYHAAGAVRIQNDKVVTNPTKFEDALLGMADFLAAWWKSGKSTEHKKTFKKNRVVAPEYFELMKLTEEIPIDIEPHFEITGLDAAA